VFCLCCHVFWTQEKICGASDVCMYALYLYFLGLSFRNTSKALEPFEEEGRRSHVPIWNWVQQFNPRKVYFRKRRISAFIIDKPCMVQIGGRWSVVVDKPSTNTNKYKLKRRCVEIVVSQTLWSIEWWRQ